MSNKYNEIYESTAKASQPEFQRMQLRHEEEISDLERQEQRAERLLRFALNCYCGYVIILYTLGYVCEFM